MREELRNKIISYNISIVERTEKAADLMIIVNELKKLPPGQLKKVLTAEVIAVLEKYGIGFYD
jgi:hypothetical protein